MPRARAGQAEAMGGTKALLRLAEIPEQESESLSGDGDRQALGSLMDRALQVVRAEFEDCTWKAFWRVTVEGCDTAAVAADLGITAGAVRQAKSRVLRRRAHELGDLPE